MSTATLRPVPRPGGPSIAEPGPSGRRRLNGWWLLLAPILVFDVILFLTPLGKLVGSSFADNAYQRVLVDPLVLRSLVNTLTISLASTIVTVVLGYVIALVLWRAGTVARVILFAVVLLPFWTGILVKNFAWAVLLQDNGIVNAFLQGIGLTNAPVELLHNRSAVIVGMVHCLLPYAVFPIFSSLAAIDDRLGLAARSLGAREGSVFRRITLPLSTPGISAAGLLVFIISTGFFITPVVMGGPGDMMIANQIDYYARQLTDFSGAAALAVVLTAMVSIMVAVYQRVLKAGGQHEDI
ncbi:MAG TPA: ABC transporter permease [Arthrobacter bacterium]|jgi:putative spermidine/putrescine transport system permease protein/mannopine transport system permease protein|nr:ABC transporter permease [Arthrobacter sp.]HAP89288.1 ABC transporter permease [Arthrobacter sp.]HBH56813.1 ABC transporter permease [Arthrobacter sp.]HCB59934.1 ABC transporter permease [Arthrobacter sp.]HCC40470.1 ABC transporter permease [Arthrobacter sp.]